MSNPLSMRDFFQGLLPEGAAWDPADGGDYDVFLDGIGACSEDAYLYLTGLANNRRPQDTEDLESLLREFGVELPEGTTEQELRDYLEAVVYARASGGTLDNLEQKLNRAGFDVKVYENKVPFINPNKVIETIEQSNLFEDWDMEAVDTSAWLEPGGQPGTVSKISSISAFEGKSLSLLSDGADIEVYQDILTVGDTYTIEGKVSAAVAQTGTCRIYNGSALIGSALDVGVAGAYASFTSTFKATDTTLRIIYETSAVGEVCYLDNFKVYESTAIGDRIAQGYLINGDDEKDPLQASTLINYNTLRNGDLELGSTVGWNSQNDAILDIVPLSYEGSYSLSVTYDGTSDAAAWQRCLIPGKRYRLTGYVRRPATNYAAAWYVWADTDEGEMSLIASGPSGSWEWFEVEFRAGESTATGTQAGSKVYLGMQTSALPGDALFFDKINLVEIQDDLYDCVFFVGGEVEKWEDFVDNRMEYADVENWTPSADCERYKVQAPKHSGIRALQVKADGVDLSLQDLKPETDDPDLVGFWQMQNLSDEVPNLAPRNYLIDGNMEIPPDDKILDGDMEQTGTDKYIPGVSAVLSKQGDAYEGDQCLRVEYGGGGSAPFASQVILTVGETFSATGWMRGDGSNRPLIYGGGSFLGVGTSSVAWQYFDFTFTPATNAEFRLYAEVNSSGEYCEFDDIKVWRQTNAVSAYTPGNSAILTKREGAFSGSLCLRVERSTSASPSAEQSVLVYGRDYRVRGVARGDSTAFPMVYDGGTQLWVGTNSTAWQAYDLTFTASSALVYLYAGGTVSAGDHADFDAIQLTDLTTGNVILESTGVPTSVLNTFSPYGYALESDGADAQVKCYGSDVLKDGDCETPSSTEWSSFGSALVSKDTGIKYAGTQSLKIAATFTPNNDGAYQSVTASGKSYRATGRILCPGALVPVLDTGTAGVSFTTRWTGANDPGVWQKIDVEFVALGSDVIFTTSSSGSDPLYIDSLQIQPVEHPALASANMTLSTWFNSTDGISSIHQGLLANSPTGNDTQTLIYKTGDVIFSNYVDGVLHEVSAAAPVDMWTHAVLSRSYDGVNTTLNLYLNGVLSDTSTAYGSPDLDFPFPFEPHVLRLMNINGTNQDLDGEMAHAAAYIAAKDQAWVTNDYNKGRAVLTAGAYVQQDLVSAVTSERTLSLYAYGDGTDVIPLVLYLNPASSQWEIAYFGSSSTEAEQAIEVLLSEGIESVRLYAKNTANGYVTYDDITIADPTIGLATIPKLQRESFRQMVQQYKPMHSYGVLACKYE